MAKPTKSSPDLGTLDPEYQLSVEDLRKDMELGVVPDLLNDGKLFRLFLAGILVVVAMVLFAAELYRYIDFKTSFQAAVAAQYPDLQRLDAKHANDLSTVAVLDSTRRIYRIPVDSAITLIVNEASL
jgi:hypothetical protein